MKTPADKSPEPQRQAAAYEVPQQQDRSNAELMFVDNRPRRQSMLQLKAMMNRSSRRDAMRSLQAKVDHSPRQVSMRLQTGMDDVPVQRVEGEEVAGFVQEMIELGGSIDINPIGSHDDRTPKKDSPQAIHTAHLQKSIKPYSPIQRKIHPSKKLTKYMERYKNTSKKETLLIETLFNDLIGSAFTYQESAIHEAIRLTGSNPVSLKALFRKMEEDYAKERDDDLGGERAHGLARHYAISDEALEGRLRGQGAIVNASRFQKDEGSKVNKLHNLIRDKLVGSLSSPAKKIGELIYDVITNPDDDYTTKANNGSKKTYLQALAKKFDDTYDHEDDRLGFTISSEWKVQVIGQTPLIIITCNFEVESWEDFEKDKWSLSQGTLQKDTVTESAKMFSGSNSPTIRMQPGDTLGSVMSQTKGIIEQSGVTLF